MATRSLYSRVVLLVLLSAGLWAQGQTQTATASASALPSTPWISSSEGNFTWPAGASTGSFTEGSSMTIAWDATYGSINLYVLWDQTLNAATNTADQRQLESKHRCSMGLR